MPQIATQTFLRISKAGEIILDPFLGSGTSAIEAVRLGRRCVGVELQPHLVQRVQERLTGQADRVSLIEGDSTSSEVARALRKALAEWGRTYADLIVLHPPYDDIIRFSGQAADLSNAGSTDAFLAQFRQVASMAYELLRPGRFAVLVIGDKYEKGALVALGFKCMQVMNEVGFVTKSIVVKNIEGNETGKGRDANLWRYRALRSGFYVFKHEYVIILSKPNEGQSPSSVTRRAS